MNSSQRPTEICSKFNTLPSSYFWAVRFSVQETYYCLPCEDKTVGVAGAIIRLGKGTQALQTNVVLVLVVIIRFSKIP